MRDILDKFEYDFNIYSVIGFILSIFYFAGAILGLVAKPTSFSLDARDTINGIYWALIYFGVPVMLLLAVLSFLSIRETGKRGIVFVISTVVMPVFLVVVVYWWWPSVFL